MTIKPNKLAGIFNLKNYHVDVEIRYLSRDQKFNIQRAY